MSLTEAVKSCISKYATFKGRAPLSEYWWFWFFQLLCSAFVPGLFFFIGYLFGDFAGGLVAAPIGSGLVWLMLILPSLAVLVRRLHDGGHSGWCIFLSLIPLIGGIWLLVYLLSGSDDENRYGLPVY
ncbi:MAG: DUF805 domain-containing protein [Alloprevotella sp.]